MPPDGGCGHAVVQSPQCAGSFVVLAHVAFSIAYVVIVVLARLRTMDGQLEEAALDLGANEWQAFRHATLPVILPGVIAAGLLVSGEYRTSFKTPTDTFRAYVSNTDRSSKT